MRYLCRWPPVQVGDVLPASAFYPRRTITAIDRLHGEAVSDVPVEGPIPSAFDRRRS